MGSVVVGYTICGALIFQAVETGADTETTDYIEDVSKMRHKTVVKLWNITNNFNILNERRARMQMRDVVKSFEHDLITYIKRGYDGNSIQDRWTFPNSLMFTLSVITTIG